MIKKNVKKKNVIVSLASLSLSSLSFATHFFPSCDDDRERLRTQSVRGRGRGSISVPHRLPKISNLAAAYLVVLPVWPGISYSQCLKLGAVYFFMVEGFL